MNLAIVKNRLTNEKFLSRGLPSGLVELSPSLSGSEVKAYLSKSRPVCFLDDAAFKGSSIVESFDITRWIVIMWLYLD